ncbi:MAG: hypothetical protein MUF48_22065 [Pirellulaceae bacterium]|jgi:hypothetical protein|nr:hypothetical protein [Pirellulaceae bacterium]
MFEKLNQLGGLLFLTAAILAGSFYGVRQVDDWGKRYRKTVRDAKVEFAEVEPVWAESPLLEQGDALDLQTIEGLQFQLPAHGTTAE